MSLIQDAVETTDSMAPVVSPVDSRVTETLARDCAGAPMQSLSIPPNSPRMRPPPSMPLPPSHPAIPKQIPLRRRRRFRYTLCRFSSIRPLWMARAIRFRSVFTRRPAARPVVDPDSAGYSPPVPERKYTRTCPIRRTVHRPTPGYPRENNLRSNVANRESII